MIRVPIVKREGFNGGSKILGHIYWDGQEIQCDPKDSPFLNYILSQPTIYQETAVSPEEDPDKWIRALPDTYHGTYLWAGAVEEIL